jgi:hypothetical protein
LKVSIQTLDIEYAYTHSYEYIIIALKSQAFGIPGRPTGLNKSMIRLDLKINSLFLAESVTNRYSSLNQSQTHNNLNLANEDYAK